jgi:hypothetical protein
MSDETNPPVETLADKQQQIDELQRQIAIDRTSRVTGVPPGLLANGKTAEQIEQIAASAIAWKAEAPAAPTPPTAAVPTYTVG